jgi:hypothetical protein
MTRADEATALSGMRKHRSFANGVAHRERPEWPTNVSRNAPFAPIALAHCSAHRLPRCAGLRHTRRAW